MSTRTHILRQRGLTFVLLCAFFPALSFAEEGGGGALEGVAAIIGASTPIFIAASQASSAKAAAAGAAAGALYQAQTAADVSKYQSDNIRDTTLYQTFVSAQVAESNNKYATQRLQMQLDVMHDSYQQNLELSRDQFKTEMNYKYQQLALKEKQANQELELQKINAKTAMVQAGLSSGFNDVGAKVASNGNSTASDESARAIKDPAMRLLTRANKIEGNNKARSGFLARNLASGSSRSKRNVVSDLSAFKSTLSNPRSFAGEAGLVQHAQRENSSNSVPFRVHSQAQ